MIECVIEPARQNAYFTGEHITANITFHNKVFGVRAIIIIYVTVILDNC